MWGPDSRSHTLSFLAGDLQRTLTVQSNYLFLFSKSKETEAVAILGGLRPNPSSQALQEYTAGDD